MALGRVTLRNRAKKRTAAYNKNPNTAREVTIVVRVERSDTSRWEEKRGSRTAYVAQACQKTKRPYRRDRIHSTSPVRGCGPAAHGKTPTEAIKKALVNMGRRKSIR